MSYPTKRLWEIANYVNWKAFKPSDWWISWLPIIRIQNLNWKNEYNYFNWNIEDKYIIQKWDILISWSASLDVYIWNWPKSVLNQHIFKVEIDENIVNKQFFYYLIKNSLAEIIHNTHWVWMKHITKWNFERIKTIFPSLPTQKLIVQKLDSSFEKIDKSIELTKKNLENIEELNKSVLEEVFSEWKYENVDLLTVADFHNKWILPNNKDLYNYIWLEHIESNTWKLVNYSKTEWKNIKSNKVSFEKWMVLYWKLRPYLNKVLVSEFDWVATTEILPIKCWINLYNYYLAYYLRTSFFVNLANSNISWARMPRVTTWFLKTVKIPLPPLQKQKEIVAQLDKVFEKNKALKESYEKKLKDLEEMKQSLLKEAFEWRLVK